MRRLEKSITVNAPVEQAYEIWTDFQNFPRFMSNVEQVTVNGQTTHWKAKVFGTTQEWDARITDLTQNQRVAWESTTGSTNNGVVTFKPTSHGTEVTVAIEYDPPAGILGDAADALTQATPSNVEQDLENFKQLIEGYTTDAQLKGETTGQQPAEGESSSPSMI
ncbi:MAG: SRPBCC family protein [Chloroflexota bacterium]|nr:SRPBCC family protein [Chloroflexota bacterium]